MEELGALSLFHYILSIKDERIGRSKTLVPSTTFLVWKIKEFDTLSPFHYILSMKLMKELDALRPFHYILSMKDERNWIL